jgi:hypothetical protein
LPEEVVVEPSLQVVVAPAAGVAAGAVVFAGAGAAAGAGVAADAAVFAAFWTPPWPLQVPLPVEVVVVPSLQVVGAGSSAQLGRANANTINGAAIKLAIVVFFISLTPF